MTVDSGGDSVDFSNHCLIWVSNVFFRKLEMCKTFKKSRILKMFPEFLLFSKIQNVIQDFPSFLIIPASPIKKFVNSFKIFIISASKTCDINLNYHSLWMIPLTSRLTDRDCIN